MRILRGGYKDTTEYLERYPGDEFIDLLGFDTYQFDRQEYIGRWLETSPY